MEDNNVVGYRMVDLQRNKQLSFLLTQLLGFPGKAGMGKQGSDDAVSAGPEILSKMFGNLEMLGDWIRGENLNLIRIRFTRKFTIEPWFDLKAVGKTLKKWENEKKDRNGAKEDPNVLPGNMAKYVRVAGSIFMDMER
jgi:hypothetical protein